MQSLQVYSEYEQMSMSILEVILIDVMHIYTCFAEIIGNLRTSEHILIFVCTYRLKNFGCRYI